MRQIYLLLITLFGLAATISASANGLSENEDFVWHNGLRQAHFGEREIIEVHDIISLEAPKRAEDAAVVPIRIKAGIPQTQDHYIKTISLIIDQNPGPLAGRFHFTPKSGRADLSMRVRINAYTPVRAIAETSDGRLYMSKRFVKASGGCSAPAGSDLEAALTRLGKMKFKARDIVLDEPSPVQLNISHPNITGLQMDQVSRLYLPAHFVKQVKVSFNGEMVMTAETDIAISEDPSFRFYFVPDRAGELTVDIVDNKETAFSQTFPVKPM
jgi:sulfur-oxidizing protein SoxY